MILFYKEFNVPKSISINADFFKVLLNMINL